MKADDVTKVLEALEAAGVRAGVTGGWGVDALLGRQTRPHGDLDLGLASDSIETTTDVLGRLGYGIVVDDRPARLVVGGEGGRIDLHPIVWGPSGDGIQIGHDGETFHYPPGSLDGHGVIAGRVVRCGTPELQWAFHAAYEPRDHDRRDMAALVTAFGLHLPPSYRPAVRDSSAPGDEE